MKFVMGLLLLVFMSVVKTTAQEVVPLQVHLSKTNPEPKVEEKIMYDESGNISGISGVTKPSMTVYLPAREFATGKAVLILPGGALRFLSWDNEGVKVARWLNEKGIAAYVLKYRLDNREIKLSEGGMPPMKMHLTVNQFDQLNHANANPSNDPESVIAADRAADDAKEALRVIRNRAKEWNINPDQVGYLGFSAGGGVALNAIIKNDTPETLPDFVATIYGPSLVDVIVPFQAPPLFIATAADHMNVAAGCLALFKSWKENGDEAEIHIYGKGKGAFGMKELQLPSDNWIDSFYTWLNSL